MELDELTSIEVAALINELKNFLKHPTIEIPTVGKYQKEANVVDRLNKIEYKFNCYRGNIDIKYAIHLRFIENNKHLVRLCINSNRHQNPDGNKVSRNHIHIYEFNGKDVINKAYELDDVPFDLLLS